MTDEERLAQVCDTHNKICAYLYPANDPEYWTERHWLIDTPENIASFIMTKGDAGYNITITDALDCYLIGTFGRFINQCEHEQKEEILDALVEMQIGKKEPSEVIGATVEEINDWYEAHDSDYSVDLC